LFNLFKEFDIWNGKNGSEVAQQSMKGDFEKKYHSVEEKHWWFVGRRKIILAFARKIYPNGKRIKILEIGCSGGPLLKLLVSRGYSRVVGIDNSKEAIQLCKERGFKDVFLMDGVSPRFDHEEFDLIIASDVLEHIQDDQKAVKEWRRILKTEGVIICFVPAFRALWSKHDEDNEHCRRYTKKDLKDMFTKNGFKIIRSSYWNIALFLPTLFYRLLTKTFFKESLMHQLKESNYALNYFLTKLLSIENSFLNIGANYPIGISVFVIAKKCSVPKMIA
jgi:SAM-dependent methyltransferase